MLFDIRSAQLTITAKPLTKSAVATWIDLDSFVEMNGAATVRLIGSPKEQAKVGFIQVLTEFTYEEKYVAGPNAFATIKKTLGAPLPMRDARSSEGKPWYRDKPDCTPQLSFNSRLARCKYADFPSTDRVDYVHARYGALEEVTYTLGFNAWLAAEDATAGRPKKLTPLLAYTLSARLLARNMSTTPAGTVIGPTICACIKQSVDSLPIPAAVYQDAFPNKGPIHRTTTESPEMTAHLAIQDANRQAAAAAAAQDANARAAAEAARAAAAPAAAATATAAAQARLAKLKALMG